MDAARRQHGRTHRPDRVRSSMTIDEARAIVQQADSGNLPVDDPDVRRVVGEANRVLVRAATWGGGERTPRSRRVRRAVWIGAITFLAVWVVGLLWPLVALLGD
jgi:CBS domain-containing protein